MDTNLHDLPTVSQPDRSIRSAIYEMKNASAIKAKRRRFPLQKMNHTTVVISRSKKYEKLLAERFAATGSGLCELKQSVEDKLPRQLAVDLGSLAFTRNQFAHDPDIEHLKDELHFLTLINRIEEAFSRLIPGYKMEQVSEVALRPSSPKETVVYVSVPGATQVMTVHGVPPMIVLGAVLIAASLLLALVTGGFTEASTYTVQETVPRWWWPWDGTRDVVMAVSRWKFPMYLLFAGSVSCVLGTASYVMAKRST